MGLTRTLLMESLKLIRAFELVRLSAGFAASFTIIISSRFLSPFAMNLTNATRVVLVTSLSIGLYSNRQMCYKVD